MTDTREWVVGDKVTVFHNLTLPKGAVSDSPRDATTVKLPKGTLAEIIGMSQEPKQRGKKRKTKMYKIMSHGEHHGKFFWVRADHLRLVE